MSVYIGNQKVGKIFVKFIGAIEPILQSRSATPTETQQVITAQSGYDALSSVTINAIPSDYVGSQVERNDSSDLTVSGATVTAPAGYYSSDASKSVATATQATPSIDVSAAGLITASCTQSTGYVSGGTKSATQQLSTQAGTTITPTTSEQTAVASGKYTTGVVKIAAMPTGVLNTPTVNSSTGVVTATIGTSGYLAANTSKTLNLTTQAAKTVTPTASSQTAVAAGRYTTGAVTVAAVPTETGSFNANGNYTPSSGKWYSSVTVAIPEYDGSYD